MASLKVFNRLSVRLSAAFLLAATLGVALVAAFAYRATSSDFSRFLSHVEAMQGMMGGMMKEMMGGEVARASLEFIGNLRQTLWIAALIGVALALLLGGLFARHIVAPLGAVTRAARRVAQGDLTQAVEVRGSSELRELAESFNTMAATLRHDQEVRRNLVADIAHELRTPLSILQANVEAMQDGILETNQQNLGSLHQETLLLSRIVDDLGTLSLAESGRLTLHPEATDLKELSQRVVEAMSQQFASKGISLSLEAPEDLRPVLADPARVEQVLRNLLGNALQYTPEGGHTEVTLVAEDEGIVVAVADSGVGIPQADLPQVFDRFFRVDRSRTRRTGGSGLGLAIVRQLVEAQGGRVAATSLPGKGSTFSFHLPYANP